MTSGKLKAKKLKRRRSERQISKRRAEELSKRSANLKKAPRTERVNEALLTPCNSYGVPEFVRRGYYLDLEFTCTSCGEKETWTASQQKWWYEVAKGFVYSTAARCSACRRKRKEHRDRSMKLMDERLT